MTRLGLLSVRRQLRVASYATPEAGSQREDTQHAFLADVEAFPDSGVAERYKRLGVSVRQGQKLKAELQAKGLIQERVQTTPKGRLKVVRLTEQGSLALSDNPESPPESS